ncbi:hypothetical protein [Burkholderia diffusa]|uniref:hypothetical protein n=1 Tax=Burkholderia diffusa TaxID=488732 RepID=UPI00075EE2A3|nr:hypothetical protein [Burkholderia diffusa]KVC44505.1 hypothetical protein WI71_17840 [Burkholderia diffusa]HDV8353864.1 hypothetical protein [Burkholderia vietnamiensis]
MAISKRATSAEASETAAAKAQAKVDELRASADRARQQIDTLETQSFAIKEGLRDEKEHRTAIRQGVKAAVETVPMPVRLEVNQVKALKILAAMQGTTASAIIRGCIHDQLIEMYDHLPGFADALEAAGVRGL